jgi:hypothetical protein
MQAYGPSLSDVTIKQMRGRFSLMTVEFHLDPDRSGKSSIVVFSDVRTGRWETSIWDFFRDETFAVVGHHDDGRIQPTRFVFAKQ